MNFSTDTGIKYAELRKNQLDTCWQWLSSGLDWGPDDVVLDIGCGTGAYTKLLVDRGNIKSITGYDKSRDFIDVARQVNFEDGKTTYEVADATDTSTLKPEWKSAFTKAISIGVFQFIEDKKAFFKNVYMCLKPGGHLLMRFQHFNALGTGTLEIMKQYMSDHPKWKPLTKDYTYDIDVALLFRGTRNQLERLVIECGFSEVNVEEGGRYLYGNHNKEEFKNMIEVLFGQIQHIPPDRKQEFIEDAYQKLVEINHRDEKDRLCIKGLFWFLTAKK
ncbi:malonyl-[acyl-carrier protein] O-methyltransferase-like isoform X1 [Ptychodera flava]|uniref:malonyl-[acyl-carrier protein] O-methyltransferase-like isoform X1 n=1 Tax=Ptychodera flava TaxID=63121 RepID=UPI00396AAC67